MSASTDKATLRVAAAVLVHDDGRVLVCQRRMGDRHHPGAWEFPGGKVEDGESVADCVRREILEELGLRVQPGRRLWRVRHRYPNRPLCDIVFVRIDGYEGTLVNRCFNRLDWAALKDLPGYDFLAGDREFVRRLASGEIQI